MFWTKSPIYVFTTTIILFCYKLNHKHNQEHGKNLIGHKKIGVQVFNIVDTICPYSWPYNWLLIKNEAPLNIGFNIKWSSSIPHQRMRSHRLLHMYVDFGSFQNIIKMMNNTRGTWHFACILMFRLWIWTLYCVIIFCTLKCPFWHHCWSLAGLATTQGVPFRTLLQRGGRVRMLS